MPSHCYSVAGRSNDTVVFVPPKPLVTAVQEPRTDCRLLGKCTVQPVTPSNMFPNWFVLEPKDVLVSAGNDSDVMCVQPAKDNTKHCVPVIVFKESKTTLVIPVQFLKVLLKEDAFVIDSILLASMFVIPVQP